MFLINLSLIILSILPVSAMPQSNHISGYVTDGSQALFRARVRVKATGIFAYTDQGGRFTLTDINSLDTLIICAWARDFYNGDTRAVAGDTGIVISLNRLPVEDNPDYAWISHIPDSADAMRCGNCHTSTLIDQWQNNAHARSATNPFFLAMYYGTDLTGTPNIGFGFKTDYPDSCGNCATCHIPGAAVNDPFHIDPKSVKGVNRDGVFCDFCHKIYNTYESMGRDLPGILAIDLLRPVEGNQVFFGPYDDIHEPDSYSPLMKFSYLCAPCHTGQFSGTPAYNCFQEWFDSSYRTQNIQCQKCHMYPDSISTYFALPEKGGLMRNPLSIPSHLQPGSRDQNILANSLTMHAAAEQRRDSILVMVTLTNDLTGHHVPTGRPSRNMLLLISAVTEGGDSLELISGEIIPSWGGIGTYSEGDFSGHPGKGFAKILQDINGLAPAPSWRPTHILSDNRIAAFASDTSYYVFRLPENAEIVTIQARLIYRRFFKPWMDEKKFAIPDIEMESRNINLMIIPSNREQEFKPAGSEYRLSQNYPNPFNPSTSIEFTLPRPEFVKLKVYDINGKEVSTLIFGRLNPGKYTFTFDGKNLASGIYYYLLAAGDYMESKKMILLQ